MTNEPIHDAGVRFPPPLVYLFGLLAALIINRARPLWLAAPEPRWMFLLGLCFMLAGLLFAGSGVATFRRHRTAVVPFHPASVIVSSGPYRMTRNPMYLGMAGSYVGCSFVLDTWWAFILFVGVVLIIDRAVIRREERYLTSAFGAEYEAYRGRVRRWV
ncbi:MAG TPA: isoprenylcysteine carboxylmethyltransferase family protein [Gemmatimonadaceae bacterium]|nr:isoprenylcysteine carboxylmethyltransferase family protein [Gemmatimonadaceae bacterium]